LPGRGVWRLARRQHGVVTARQLLDAGLSFEAIRHRVRIGRLHRLHRGVYAVGRPDLTRRGRWMAAVLSCGKGAALSHESAAALWGIEDLERGVTVSIPWPRQSRRRDIRVRCLKFGPHDRTRRDGIPLTSPARTLIDLATVAGDRRLETAVNAADKLDLVDPETLREAATGRPGQAGAPRLRRLLDRATFRLTDSELERRFLRLVKRAGLTPPQTQACVGDFRVDFLWRDLGLVVETDGLRYHRTPTQQARDRRRDQALIARGLTVLRFTHAQVAHGPDEVAATLESVARRGAGFGRFRSRARG
jgi:very-short-patch-repair endonuclease